MIKKLKSFYKWALPYAIPLFAGIIQIFSFAPYQVASAAFISIALLIYSLKNQSPKQGFIRGGLFGLGLFGFGASWIYVSIYRYGGESAIISSVITLGFIFILSLFTGLVGYLLNRFWPESNVKRSLLAFPALWVLVEIFRGWFLTGFPWLYLGYSQFSTHLIAYSTIGGVWLVSWSVAFTGGFLYEIYEYVTHPNVNRKFLYKLLGTTLFIWALASLLNSQSWTHPIKHQTVAMVQGNIPQQLRWDNRHINVIANTYRQLTFENMDVDLIIWPESAIPVPLPGSQPFFQEIGQLATSQSTGFIAGVPIQAEIENKFYNGIISLGQGQGVYYKKHLVPFGEYVPLEKLLRGLIEFFDLPMSDFIKGTNQPPMMTQGYTVAPAICYEIAYPFTIRNMTQQAGVIVTISNDAWFGESLGPKQHLQIARMRAVETGRYVLRATNSGITAIIGPKGLVLDKLPSADFSQPEQKGTVLLGEFNVMEGQTPWLRFGPWLLMVFLATCLGISLRKKKKK